MKEGIDGGILVLADKIWEKAVQAMGLHPVVVVGKSGTVCV